MRYQGRYLRFRHVLPELFGPAVQARRGLLRFRWFLLQRIDFRPMWTIGAAAGLGGVLLTVSLFFLSGALRPVVAAREATRLESPVMENLILPQTPLPQQFIPLQEPAPTIVPDPVPTFPLVQLPELSAGFARLTMPFGWEDRRLATIRSTPLPMEPTLPHSFNQRDGWVRSLFRSYPSSIQQQAYVPYREPAGLRWNSVTPEVRVSNVVSRGSNIASQTRPLALIEKQMPPNFSGDRPLEYRLIVSNPGSKPLPDVSVFEAIDVSRVVNVNPPARVEPNGLSWRLNGLAPGERRELQITVWTEGLMSLSAATDVELADRVSAVVEVFGQTEEPFFSREPVAPPPAPLPTTPPVNTLPSFPPANSLPPFPTLEETPVSAPSIPPPITPAEPLPSFPSLPVTPVTEPLPGRPLLKLHAAPPSAVAVGEDASTWYDIENVGDAAATDIVLRLKLAEGLQHHDGSLDVEYKVLRLEPGEKKRAQLVTRATTHGVYSVSGELVSGSLREITDISLFAPQTETAIGSAGTNEESSETDQGIQQCHCTLLVRRTVVAGR